MPAKKKAAKKPSKFFEESRWNTATKLRGNGESSGWSRATAIPPIRAPKSEQLSILQHSVAGFCKKVSRHAADRAEPKDTHNTFHIAA